MDSRLRGNDINCIFDRHSRDSGNDAIDKALVAATAVIPAEAGMMPSTPIRLSLLTVIPAKAGIHTAYPNTDAVTAGLRPENFTDARLRARIRSNRPRLRGG